MTEESLDDIARRMFNTEPPTVTTTTDDVVTAGAESVADVGARMLAADAYFPPAVVIEHVGGWDRRITEEPELDAVVDPGSGKSMYRGNGPQEPITRRETIDERGRRMFGPQPETVKMLEAAERMFPKP